MGTFAVNIGVRCTEIVQKTFQIPQYQLFKSQSLKLDIKKANKRHDKLKNPIDSNKLHAFIKGSVN